MSRFSWSSSSVYRFQLLALYERTVSAFGSHAIQRKSIVPCFDPRGKHARDALLVLCRPSQLAPQKTLICDVSNKTDRLFQQKLVDASFATLVPQVFWFNDERRRSPSKCSAFTFSPTRGRSPNLSAYADQQACPNRDNAL